MGPLALLGIQAGLTGGGYLLNRLTNERPEVPDLSADVVAAFDRERARVREALDAREDRLNADLAAEGVTGSGGVSARESLYRTTNDALLDLAARRADARRQAETREEGLRYRQARGRYQNRAQGIADLIGQGGRLLGTYLMAKQYGFQPADAMGEGYRYFPKSTGTVVTNPYSIG